MQPLHTVIQAIVACALVVCFTGCREKIGESETARSWQHEESQSGIRLRLPPTAQVTTEKGPDFFVCRISTDPLQHDLLQFYVGNYPMQDDFDKLPHRKRRVSLNGAPGEEKRWSATTGNQSRELIVSTGEDFPGYVHIFYSDLPPADAVVADDIISSMRVK